VLRGSPVDELIRRSGEIDVHIVRGEGEESPSAPRAPRTARTRWPGYAAALGVLAGCTLVGFPLAEVLSPVNLTMLYLAGVVFVATRYGRGPSVVSAILAPTAVQFFFTQPTTRSRFTIRSM